MPRGNHLNAVLFLVLFPDALKTLDDQGNRRTTGGSIRWRVAALDNRWYLPNYFWLFLQNCAFPVCSWLAHTTAASFFLTFAILPLVMVLTTPFMALQGRIGRSDLTQTDRAFGIPHNHLVHQYGLAERWTKLGMAMNKGYSWVSYQFMVWPLQTLLYGWLSIVLGIMIASTLIPCWCVFPVVLRNLPGMVEQMVLLLSRSTFTRAFYMRREREMQFYMPVEARSSKRGLLKRSFSTLRRRNSSNHSAMTRTTVSTADYNNSIRSGNNQWNLFYNLTSKQDQGTRKQRFPRLLPYHRRRPATVPRLPSKLRF